MLTGLLRRRHWYIAEYCLIWLNIYIYILIPKFKNLKIYFKCIILPGWVRYDFVRENYKTRGLSSTGAAAAAATTTGNRTNEIAGAVSTH